MKRKEKIWEFDDGSSFGYKTGAFDNWAVYYESSNLNDLWKSKTPKDEFYLSEFKKYCSKVSIEKMKQFFDEIFDEVTERAKESKGNPTPDNNSENLKRIKEQIDKLDLENKEKLIVYKIFVILYLTMISEWHYTLKNGRRSKFRHLLKKMAIYQVLNGMSPSKAASYSRGKNKAEIHTEFENIKVENFERIEEMEVEADGEQFPMSE